MPWGGRQVTTAQVPADHPLGTNGTYNEYLPFYLRKTFGGENETLEKLF